MAMFAVAFGAINNRRRPRGPNVNRTPCVSGENSRRATRLSMQEIDMLAHEYIRWRDQRDGVRMKYLAALKRVEVSTCTTWRKAAITTKSGGNRLPLPAKFGLKPDLRL